MSPLSVAIPDKPMKQLKASHSRFSHLTDNTKIGHISFSPSRQL